MSNNINIKLFNNLENSIQFIKENKVIILVGFDRIKREKFNGIKTYNINDLDSLIITEGCKNICMVINTYTPLKAILISKLNFYANLYNVDFKLFIEYCNNTKVYDKFSKYNVTIERCAG